MGKRWKKAVAVIIAIVMVMTIAGDSTADYGKGMSMPQKKLIEQMF